MARLIIHCLDGFADSDVIVEVDGVQVASESGITTKLLLGAAEDIIAPVPDGPARVTVRVADPPLSAEVDVAPQAEIHLIASITHGGLTLGPPPPGFGLM